MFFRSPSGTSLAAPAFRTSAVLLTGTDSPVSAASSIFMLALSKIRPSAGTASPASRITISPGTSSSLFFTSIFPPRSIRVFCSPMTHSSASDKLDLPLPLGPTITVISFSKLSRVFSGNDLKPWSSSAFKYTVSSPQQLKMHQNNLLYTKSSFFATYIRTISPSGTSDAQTRTDRSANRS